MSDDEEQYNPQSHKKLLQAISSRGNVQHIQRSTRDERQPVQDEFQLVKSSNASSSSANVDEPRAVGLNDLVQILRTSSKHLDTGKKLKNVQSTKKVLQKPLEKPAADRIKRTIGYEGVSKKLGRWDAVVAKQRSAETQIFPIPSETIYVNTSAHAKPLKTSIKSDLAKELEESNQRLRELRKKQIGDMTDDKLLAQQENALLEKKLTRDELFARRKELAYLKMRESQKSAKARMQKKIKSKKYHKLQKRHKMLEQIKEFELLQKTNPEAALEKLDALEKSRVKERASLRHKNTGTWAKNLQVRAKYDKEVRKDLAEQLAVSRQLTQKQHESESEEEQETNTFKLDEEDKLLDNDPFNPWTKVKSKSKTNTNEEQTDDTNWRKYWTERNETDKLLAQHREDIQELKETKEKEESAEATPKAKKSSVKKVKKAKITVQNGWKVEKLSKNATLEEIFEQHGDILKEKVGKKLEKLRKQADKLKEKPTKGKQLKKKKDALKNLKDLTFKNTKQRIEIDEPLNSEDIEAKTDTANSNVLEEAEIVEKSSAVIDSIDPTKVTTLNWTQSSRGRLNDALGVGELEADFDEEDNTNAERQLTLTEAFEDDDIIADFNKDKEKDSELKNTELQLAMPGWGSWAGAGISPEVMERRNKRLLLKLAVPEKRRDENKDNLYINETSSKDTRSHLVSSVPFPFRSLADYEASIRAPIGRNFVPETAFRMLTRPAVITRKGQVIEPMDESELIKPDRRLRHIVDRRIKRLPKHKPLPPKAKIA
ncbi:LOW QUALITY PROTEIN: U3 small nucleolar RNA-associated protein 14 homolog A [Drosophila tropicalis]|uniref:LOW QUALITY PROTEIN: U3 small nucleolar RNA-associated protein 14 homolog A n=1 Tax=Drosophila tropicalis TaxID=46794 RepID=UPI0035ABABDF